MDEQLERAARWLMEDPRMMAVWGFGSRVHGGAGPASDVDLAVLLDPQTAAHLDLAEELRLRSRVVEELRRDDVDLVILDSAPPLLRDEAVAAGRRLFARDEEVADRSEERAARECWDTAHQRRVQQEIAREAREARGGAE